MSWLDTMICGVSSLSREERLRARITVVSLAVVCAAFAAEASVHLTRDHTTLFLLSAGSALPLAGLLVLVARRDAARTAAHGLMAVLSLHCIYKIAASGGDTRVFYYVGMLPLMAVPVCGLRGGVAWSLFLVAGVTASGLLHGWNVPLPFALDTALIPNESFWVAAGFVSAGLGVATCHEVAQRRSSEDALNARDEVLIAKGDLEASKELFRALLEHSFEGAAIVDPNGHLSYLRPTAEGRILGYRREDLGDASLAEFAASILHPEDRELAMQTLRDCVSVPGKLVQMRLRLRGKDGTWRLMEAAAHNLTREPAVQGIVLNYRSLSHSGGAEGDGAFERRLIAEKFESLGRFAGGIAHDFNNQLTVIGAHSEMAASAAETEAERVSIRDAQQAEAKLTSLVSAIASYGGHRPSEPVLTDLASLVLDVVARRRPTLPSTVEVDVDVPSRDSEIRADEGMVRDATSEVLENAVEALASRSGRVTLEVGSLDATAELLSEFFDVGRPLLPGAYHFVAVSDDGCGIAPYELSRIFDPFYTTRFPSPGLGLAKVLGMLRAHRGGVRIETELGEGTKFTLLFPAA